MTSNVSQFDPILQTLSVRAKNCCEAEGIHSIEELAAYAATHDLLKVPRCGPKTVLELKEAIDMYARPDVKKANEHVSVIPDSLQVKVEEVFDNQVLSIDDEEIFNELSERFSSANSFINSLVNTPQSLFASDTELTYKQNIRIWEILIQILYSVSNINVSNHFESVFTNKVLKAHAFCKEILRHESNKLLFDCLPKGAIMIVKDEFAKIFNSLGTRAQNYLRSIRSSHISILELLDKLQFNTTDGKVSRSRTIVEISQSFSNYRAFLVDLSESAQQNINSLVIKHEFPYLNTEQIEWVTTFKQQEGKIPFFFVVFCYFKNAINREDKMYDRYVGITVPSESLNDIAASYELTRERVRQITMRYKPTSILHLANSATTEQYSFMGQDIIDVNKCLTEISKTEFAEQTGIFTAHSFEAIMQLFTSFSSVDFNDSKFLLSNRFVRSFDINNAWIDITKALNTKTAEDVSIPIDFFISNYILSNEIEYTHIRDFIGHLIVVNFEAEIDENFNVIIQKNCIDFEDELFRIIERAGKPMLFDDIMEAFYQIHPEYASKSPATLRLIMFNSPRIKSVGKTSSFSLSKWNFSTLTVRGLIAAILQESDVPLSIETLVEILETKGRKTNKNSVNSSILSDTKNNFVKFKGGLVGIGSKIYAPIYEIQDPEATARKSFSERFKDYLEFIDSNLHVPYSTQDETEASLYRWYRNVEKGVIDATPQQKELLRRELKKREQYIMTKAEFDFSQRCADFKYYVSTEFEIPTQKSDSSLYMWFLKARKESDKFTRKNAAAYNDLIDFLAQYGFSFE